MREREGEKLRRSLNVIKMLIYSRKHRHRIHLFSYNCVRFRILPNIQKFPEVLSQQHLCKVKLINKVRYVRKNNVNSNCEFTIKTVKFSSCASTINYFLSSIHHHFCGISGNNRTLRKFIKNY